MEANMGAVIRFIPKAERERLRLIREARANYDSVFPPVNPDKKLRGNEPIIHSVNGTWIHQGDDWLS
jgi:hypothetical protein